ncbi:mCG146227, partial [Mus musculus]
ALRTLGWTLPVVFGLLGPGTLHNPDGPRRDWPGGPGSAYQTCSSLLETRRLRSNCRCRSAQESKAPCSSATSLRTGFAEPTLKAEISGLADSRMT